MHVRTIRPSDIAEVAQVEAIAWGENAASPQTIARRAEVFEQGSIVVIEGDQIVGYAASQLTDYISTSSWADQTGDGTIEATHCPEGAIAYGVSMSARPGVSGKGVAHHVIAEYTRMYLGGGCRAMCVGSRVPGFARWLEAHPNAQLKDYVQPAQDGRFRDPELRLYAGNGFGLLWEMPDYYPDDKSAGHGAMMIRTLQ